MTTRPRPQLIPLVDHPNNLDPTARIVWEDRVSLDSVYSVRGGYLANVSRVGCFAELFGSSELAQQAIADFRSRVTVEPMFPEA